MWRNVGPFVQPGAQLRLQCLFVRLTRFKLDFEEILNMDQRNWRVISLIYVIPDNCTTVINNILLFSSYWIDRPFTNIQPWSGHWRRT